jgi:hypothetical protein
MRVDEACEKIPDLACSSKNVARDILRSLASFTDFSAGVKKRLLCEVIHKIKVDSKNEVHLFLRPPQRLEPLGLTVQRGVLHREKTQNADYFYRTKLSLIEYYKKGVPTR